MEYSPIIPRPTTGSRSRQLSPHDKEWRVEERGEEGGERIRRELEDLERASEETRLRRKALVERREKLYKRGEESSRRGEDL